MWDPAQYRRFDDERSRPFHDLLAAVPPPAEARRVVDLGCGTGHLTATLSQRWPHAHVVGVDSSAEMLAQAGSLAEPGRLEFRRQDLRTWRAEEPVDVIVSNAALQWVPGHLQLLGTFAADLAAGGVLAFQVPGNFDAPSHVLLSELRRSPAWRDRVGTDADRSAAVHPPQLYLEALVDAGLRPRVWETTYLHVLTGESPVLEWVRGTALRPVLARLTAAEQEEFLADYGDRLRHAYPPGPHGTVLPFRRIFAVAVRP